MAEQRVQRRLAAILAADMVGFSRLMGADEEGTLARLKTLRGDLIDPTIAKNGGRVFKTTGDGALVEFPSAVDAARSAIEIQRALAKQAGSEPIQFRIGINVGDIIVDADDIYGDGVNIAARLEGLAEPNGIVISGTVYDQIKGKLDLPVEDLGEQSLKNIAEPVRAFAITPGAPAARPGPGMSAVDALPRPAIAVLPFTNMSGDPEQEYFADGLTEDIITALSRWHIFPVIARNSSFVYKGRSVDVRQVGEELGARYVIEGSVRKAGNRVRVTAQLINTETSHHIWADQYDRDLQDIFALQDEITQTISAIIEPNVERAEHQRITSRPAPDLAAWEYGLRGYACIYEGSPEKNLEAQEMFRRAIELDPNFSRAYTGLAYTYVKDLRFFRSLDREECVRGTFENARRAIALDEMDPEARSMLARAYLFVGQHDAGVAEAQRVVELNPYDAFAHNILGASLALASGRYDEGIPSFERALQLNPLDPQYHLFLTQLSLAELGVGRLDDAAAHAREALRRSPDFLEARIALASCLGHLEALGEARSAIEPVAASAKEYVETHILYARDLKDRLLDGLYKAGLPK